MLWHTNVSLIIIVGHLAIQVHLVKFGLCSASDFNSCFFFFFLAGVGRTAPDPSASVTLDGVQVPLGKGSHTNIDDTSLLYNEYPLTVTTWFMNLIMILPKDVTFFLLCYIIDYLIVRRKVQSQTSYILFLTLN